MRKAILIMLTSLAVLACGNKTNADQAEKPSPTKDCVEVLYFHGKQRCATCLSIEKNTKALLQDKFSKQLQDGRMEFHVIDISQKENEQIARKYQVTWSSLILVWHKNGKETSEDLTEFAFSTSRKMPEKFKEELSEKINQALQ